MNAKCKMQNCEGWVKQKTRINLRITVHRDIGRESGLNFNRYYIDYITTT